ncbi:MAG TPA: outer membrane beta-barrel protein [Ramlibacter sp.]|jgi:exopolysaccharide biosynthesis operon protein EpsL|uniref:outer membrane beta-barrel protein n=1 Tax=Ramlibacter sp. TaxID=1917967 RepID=UPI002D606FAF|nr:outer membrane beta-barrel protein [Ramlibacter sp.]HZY19120.1 outer membrane beta-barrel protein [Ramlibacter sp.]
MKKSSFRPLLTAAAACLLPVAAVHAQTTLQSPGGQPGESAAQPAGTPMATPMGENMAVPMSPAASISQPFPPVTSRLLDGEREGLQLRARAGVERDDNVLRTASDEVSDTITTMGLGLRYNKRIGLQRFVVDAEVDRFDYDKLALKYNTVNYAAAWYWALGNRFDGIASADRRQFRDVTSNGLAGAVSRRTERNELLEGGYRLGAGWRVLAGVQHNESTSTDPSSWDGNPSVDSVRVGTSYEFASGNTAALRYRRGDGDYNNSVLGVPGFKDNEIEGTVRWALTAKTSVDGRLSWLERKHDGAPSRDFDGVTALLNANWDATAKTRVFAGYGRDLGSYLFGDSGHLESDRVFVGGLWRPTVQTGVTLRYEHENRKWEDVVGSVDIGRSDKFNVLAVGLDWQPLRSVGVSAQLRNEKRDSSLPAFNYRANVIGLAVKFTI